MKRFVPGMVLSVLTFATLSAQQDPQFTQFFYNKLIMNPAYAGAKDAVCFTFLGRSQWTGLKGAPNSALLSFDMPVWQSPYNDDQVALGVTTYLDYIGYEKNYALRIAGAYRRKNLGPGDLSVGVDIGVVNKGLEAPQWTTPNTLPYTFDPGIPAAGPYLSNFGLDLGLGVYYSSSTFYAGLSVLHLTGSSFKDLNIRQAQTLYFIGGYTFAMPHQDWQLNPNLLLKSDFATAQLDANLNVIWRQFYWAGLTYRIQDAVAVNLGMSMGAFSASRWLKGLQISYSYDINTSRLRTFNGGSHELVIRYCIAPQPRPMIPIYDVRHLDSRRDRGYR